MNLAPLLLLAVCAAASPASDALKAARDDIKRIAGRPYEIERDGEIFSWFWRQHVAYAFREAREGRPRPYLSYDQEERMFFDWRSKRNAEAVARGDHGWFKLDDWEKRKLFRDGLDRERRILDMALDDYATLPRLRRFRDKLLAETPEPAEAVAAVREARGLLASGRRAEAAARLQAAGADADFSPRLLLARAASRMAAGDLKLPWDDWDKFYEALKARDPRGLQRELSWEMLCRAEQSRTGDWKFSHPYGNATDAEWETLVRAVGLRAGDADYSTLLGYLKEHPTAAAAAARAARGRPVCGLVRVAADGSGDARTIADGLALLSPFGGRGVILLGPGRYEEPVRVLGGRVVLRARTRGTAVIAAPAGRPGLTIDRADGFVLDGIGVASRGANAVEIRASRGVTLKHCELEAPAGRGVFNDGSPEVSIWDCATKVAPF